MSFHSEHMDIILPDGMVRGDVEIVPISKIMKMNEKTIRQRSKMLYGNTKYTDELIVFFLIKHKLNGKKAARDIGCHYQSLMYRTKKLNIKLKGIGTGDRVVTRRFSDAQLITVCKECKGNIRQMAIRLGVKRVSVRERCEKINLKAGLKAGIKAGRPKERR